jgi:hypothetical protein
LDPNWKCIHTPTVVLEHGARTPSRVRRRHHRVFVVSQPCRRSWLPAASELDGFLPACPACTGTDDDSCVRQLACSTWPEGAPTRLLLGPAQIDLLPWTSEACASTHTCSYSYVPPALAYASCVGTLNLRGCVFTTSTIVAILTKISTTTAPVSFLLFRVHLVLFFFCTCFCFKKQESNELLSHRSLFFHNTILKAS